MSFFRMHLIIAQDSVLSTFRISYTPDRYIELNLQREKKANVCNAWYSLKGAYYQQSSHDNFLKLHLSFKGLELFELPSYIPWGETLFF